ncbi:MAG: DNRLRE domain-containing protein [Pirellulales bacterium]
MNWMNLARGVAVMASMAAICVAEQSARADVMMFQAAKDTSLFETAAGNTSAGGAAGIFVGRNGLTAGTAVRRGMIAFDLSAIPTGATINSVSLRMFVAKSSSQGPPTTSVALHRVLGDWGEGTVVTSSGSSGGAALSGDATWVHQFFPGDPWTNVGGDFVGLSSAEQIVGSQGQFITWTSTPPLVDDVQGWIDGDTANFGWLLRGNESTARTAREFASSEFLPVSNRPALTVDFTPPSMRTPGDVNNDGTVNAADVALLVSSYGATTTANNFDVGEFSGDGLVGLADLAILHQHLSATGLTASPAAVPEPSALMLCGTALCAMVLAGRRRAVGRK